MVKVDYDAKNGLVRFHVPPELRAHLLTLWKDVGLQETYLKLVFNNGDEWKVEHNDPPTPAKPGKKSEDG